MIRLALIALAALTLSAMIGAAAAESTPPRFHLPVDCVIGETCFVQFHVDLAAGKAIQDYACGRLTYDEHHGTDFRLPDYAAMRAGVDVLAAADGVVRAVRDGEPEQSVDERGQESLGGKLAGNAVVISHGDGWESQYSHLMKGTLAVKPGDAVKKGQRLGRIGLSGNSNFPHLDFAVRKGEAVIDPFIGPEPGQGCEAPRAPLWDDETLAMLPYVPSGVLIAGFAAGPPDKKTVRDGRERTLAFPTDAPALTFYADFYGVRAGDAAEFRLIGPGDIEVVTHRQVFEADAHQHFNFAGRKRPKAGWPPGVYRGEFRLIREVGGKPEIVAEATREATLSAR